MGSTHSRDRSSIVVPYGKGENQPKRFNQKELKLMTTYLSSFVFETKSTEAHRRIASSHWELVFASHDPSSKKQASSRITQLYDVFYALLENQSPELKNVFRSSMQVRGKVLVHISIGMRTLLASDKLGNRIARLTQTHHRFGVKVGHYNAVGQALIEALKITSGKHWSLVIQDAWERLFSHSSVILIAAQLKSETQSQRFQSFSSKSGPSETMFKGQRTRRRFLSYPSINHNSIRDSTQATTIMTVGTSERWLGSASSIRGLSAHSKREAESTGRAHQSQKSTSWTSRKPKFSSIVRVRRSVASIFSSSTSLSILAEEELVP